MAMNHGKIQGVDFKDVMADLTGFMEHWGKEKFEKVNLEPALTQNFPLKNPTVNYVIKNANARLLQKLYLCCKYFFLKRPFVIVEKLRLDKRKDMICRKEIISTYPRRKYASQLVNLWLTGSLDVSASDHTGVHDYRGAFVQTDFTDFWDDEKIFKNITQNDIKILSIKAAGISFNNLQILCGSKFLTDVNLNVRHIERDGQDEPVSMEDILELVPHVQKFSLCHCYCTPETPKKLLALKFENKVHHFRFKYIKDEIDPKQFFMFFIKNLTNNGRAEIKFDIGIPELRRRLLTAHLTAYMKAFNAKYRNKIYISFF